MKEVEILLVEDNPTDAELCIRALQKHNLANSLMWVKDGAEALDFIFATGTYSQRSVATPPKVILLDLRLPKIGGMEVLRKVKADERTRAIPIVVLTSSREDCDVAESYNSGVNSYISKPVEFDAFVNTVSELGMYWLLMNYPPATGG
ncbi:MAG: response regulator [Candidatus Thiodiazotropha sp.]